MPENEIVIGPQTMDLVNIPVQQENFDMVVNREPKLVLAEAKKAAEALNDVIKNKPNPFKLNGEQYLEFEDWQLLGRFYGITAMVKETKFVEMAGAQGFQARAVAIHVHSGREISAAEAICLNNEPNWRTRQLSQLESMAQTRASAKALRNVLSFVVVLAGYKPTPAEEFVETTHVPQTIDAKANPVDNRVSDAQRRRFFAIANSNGKNEDEIKAYLAKTIGSDSTKDITKDVYEEVCQWAGAKS